MAVEFEGAEPVEARRVVVIECNIDDMSPEQMAYACEKLMESGALDVWQTPIIMKKGRMASQLSVLCAKGDEERMDASENAKRPIRVQKKIGRNDPCPCGSGKKYKYCCGKEE